MKRLLVLLFTTFTLFGCYRPMTTEEWRQECLSHPYYTYYTAGEAAEIEWEMQGPLGGRFDHKNNRCSVISAMQVWDSSDPDTQYTIHALKELTGENTFEAARRKLSDLEVLDFRDYPDIHDLRPLISRNYKATKAIYLPDGAKVNTLWGLQSELEILDAPNLTVTGTRPEDCPTVDYIFVNNAAPPAFYPPSVMEFCKNLGR
ncbi:MAG: hypothetical protein OXT67_02460 [Zetaproteobacteria bacterium]|nr:hypothetical protein [Zetaproteobacteria bacterium]